MPGRKTWSSKLPVSEVLPEAFKPRVVRGLRLEVNADATSARVDLSWKALEFEPEDAGFMQKLFAIADGSLDQREISQRTGRELGSTIAALQYLFEEGVVESGSSEDLPGVAFCRNLVNRGRRLQDRHSESGAITRIMEGRGHARLLLGFLVERHHFTSLVATHLSEAIRSAQSERLRMMLTEYLADEYTHGPWLRTGLETAIPKISLETASVLPSTAAIIGFLAAAARSDLLAYAGCVASLEQPSELPGVADSQIEFWDQLELLGLVKPEVIRPFRMHELMDIEQQHNNLAAEIYAEHGQVTHEHGRRIQRTVAEFLYTLREWDRAIVAFYAEPEGEPYFVAELD